MTHLSERYFKMSTKRLYENEFMKKSVMYCVLYYVLHSR